MKKNQPSKPHTKFEFNLAEFPIAVLSKRPSEDIKVIEYKDSITASNGQVINRVWRVSPSPLYGWGSSEVLSTLFELFQMWRDQGFQSPMIRFGSLYNLCRRLGLKDSSLVYNRLKKDLIALTGLLIHAESSFWDNRRKIYTTAVFHLFERVYFIHQERKDQEPLPFGYIEASRELFQSLKANAVINLEGVTSSLFHSFTPTEQRLALYLGKMLHRKTHHRRSVAKLSEQLPILAEKQKHIKQLLIRACEGLIEKRFPYLTGYRFEKSADRGENIIFVRRAKQVEDSQPRLLPPPRKRGSDSDADFMVEDIIEVTGDRRSEKFYRMVAQKLDEGIIRRALSETKAEDIPRGTIENRGAYFTNLIKKYAAERGIVLNRRKKRGEG